jgi:hypothetical protein
MDTNQISSAGLLTVISREKRNYGSNFTLKSQKSGVEYTYKINRSKFNDKWYTHVSVETQYLSFKYLGSYFKGKLYRKGETTKTPSAIAISYVLDKVEKGQFEWLDEKMELMHTGSCMVCGRELTDSNSIKNGIGPVCMGSN